VKSGQLIEELIVNLRQANEHLVIASLDANIREAKAAEAHSRQTLFLSMLAHELRNPLAPIAMSVELRGKIPGTSAEVQTLQHILARQTTHLTRLVEDLMDATRINSGKIKIHKASVLLSQLIAQAVETSQPLLDIHRQAVNLDIPHEPVWINGDVVRLTQLFSNLIINASKFSANESSIHISAKRDATSVVISVKDCGIGISPELQPFIFDLFMQGPAGDGLMASGLGIGLSLVQTIAKLHGGTVKVISQGIGHGSEFIVSLPVVLGSGAEMGQVSAQVTRASESPEMHLISKRILLIDDNEDVNKTMSAFLMEAGHEVECALDGATGLHMERLQHHDVICCDIGLPGMDGYEVAKQLHQGSSRARLIAISGYDQPEQRDRALKAGFDHYLVKPIFGQELLELIELPENEALR
jgi:two-component system CheB/CheR fusion protein